MQRAFFKEDLSLDKPRLWLAPFRGITGKAYRNALGKHMGGIEAFFAPFVSGVAHAHKQSASLSDLLPAGNLVPVVPQILSKDPAEILHLAHVLGDWGYGHLNWNLGCPFPRIANKQRGCGLLPFPEEIKRILDGLFPRLPLSLSIKTRLGFQQPDEILRVLASLNDYPIHSIIIHARTGKQRYRGEAMPEHLRACTDESKHPIVYNGDLFHASAFKRMQRQHPSMFAWMLGRGALINPFLALQIRGEEAEDGEKRAMVSAFHQDVYENTLHQVQHAKRSLGAMKALWFYMSGLFAQAREVFSRIKRTQELAHYLRETSWALEQDFATESQMEAHFKGCTRQH